MYQCLRYIIYYDFDTMNIHSDNTKTLMKKLFILSLLLFLFSFGTLNTNAQFGGGATTLSISPEFPRPGNDVSLTLTSLNINLDSATITWYLNGEERGVGIGKKKVFVRVGDVGKSYEVLVVVIGADGKRVSLSSTILPQGVDIVWQAHAYTPPFYKGRSLSPSAGLVVVTAIPDLIDARGKKVDPSNAIYTWSERGIVLGNASGYGKQSIILENGTVPQSPLIVTVTVSSFDNTVKAKQTVKIPVTDPVLVFYEKHPLKGLEYNNALTNNFIMTEEEIVIQAEPFFFSLDDLFNKLVRYRWKINGADISIPRSEQGKKITFRKEPGVSGEAEISLKIENYNIPFRVLQGAKESIRFNLGE